MSPCPRFVIGLVVITIAACSGPQREPDPVDAVSGATRSARAPASPGHQVLGELPGLNGVVVRYDEHFYRGGTVISEEGLKALVKLGVKLILSADTSPIETEHAERLGLKLVEVPIDTSPGIRKDDLAKVLELLSAAGEQGPIYAHCYEGKHRVGALGVAYRVHVRGWQWRRAVDEFARLGGDEETDAELLESVRQAP